VGEEAHRFVAREPDEYRTCREAQKGVHGDVQPLALESRCASLNLSTDNVPPGNAARRRDGDRNTARVRIAIDSGEHSERIDSGTYTAG
jgi:hypothetical protein